MLRTSYSDSSVTYLVGVIHVVCLSVPIIGVRLGLPILEREEKERINPTSSPIKLKPPMRL